MPIDPLNSDFLSAVKGATSQTSQEAEAPDFLQFGIPIDKTHAELMSVINKDKDKSQKQVPVISQYPLKDSESKKTKYKFHIKKFSTESPAACAEYEALMDILWNDTERFSYCHIEKNWDKLGIFTLIVQYVERIEDPEDKKDKDVGPRIKAKTNSKTKKARTVSVSPAENLIIDSKPTRDAGPSLDEASRLYDVYDPPSIASQSDVKVTIIPPNEERS